MQLFPGGSPLALYLLTAVCGATLLVVLLVSERNRRNAGFASKARLRRHLSARAALKAKEIRPSHADNGGARTPAVNLAKNRRSTGS